MKLEKIRTAQPTVYVLLVFGMTLFGTGTPVSKVISQEVPVYLASFLRVLVSAVVLTPFLWQQRNKLAELSKRDYLYLLLITIVGMVLFSITMLEGTSRISGVMSSIIMSLTPAITGVGSVLFFKEKFSWQTAVSLCLAVVGVVIINVSSASGGVLLSSTQALLGVALVFGAVLCEATFTLTGKKISADLNPVLTTGISAWGATVLFLPFALYQSFTSSSLELNWSTTLAIGWWGVGTLCLGTILWYQGMKRAKAMTASVFMAVMPISALVFSYLLLGENFKWIHVLGFGIAATGIVLGSLQSTEE